MEDEDVRDKYLNQTMRLARIFFLSIEEMKEKGMAVTSQQGSLSNLASAFCMLYEIHYDENVWDLANSTYAEDKKELEELIKKEKDPS